MGLEVSTLQATGVGQLTAGREAIYGEKTFCFRTSEPPTRLGAVWGAETPLDAPPSTLVRTAHSRA